MIKAKQAFSWSSDLEGYGFHGNKVTIFCLTSEYYWLDVLSAKFYFFKSVQYIKSYSHLTLFSIGHYKNTTTWGRGGGA